MRVLTHGCVSTFISRTLALKHCVVTCLGSGLWDGVSLRALKQGGDKGRILYTALPLSGTCLEISFLYEITSVSPAQIPAWKLTLAVPSSGSANVSEQMPYLSTCSGLHPCRVILASGPWERGVQPSACSVKTTGQGGRMRAGCEDLGVSQAGGALQRARCAVPTGRLAHSVQGS